MSRLSATAKTVSEEKAKHQAMTCALERNYPAVELGSFCRTVEPDIFFIWIGDFLGFAVSANWVDHMVMKTESCSVVTGLKNKMVLSWRFFLCVFYL